MNKFNSGTATVVLLALLLFYFPSVISILSENHAPPWMHTGNVIMSTVYTVIFLTNYFLIIPRTLFGHGRKAGFYLWNVLLIAISLMIIPIWFETHGGLPGPGHATPRGGDWKLMGYLRFSLRDGVMMILCIALAYALQLARERERLKHRELELNAERRQLELRGLKMQLNPHFLFNSLNNIYALIAISSERAQEALHDLSGMLRYMIYETSSDRVSLTREMAFIEDFIRLMRLRFSPSAKVEYQADFESAEGISIPPLLFLTLVENAFKHYAPGHDGKGHIRISISVDDDAVECRVENTYKYSGLSNPVEADDRGQREEGMQYGENRTDTTGVGLRNIERQLSLLFPNAFKLSVNGVADLFIARLRINRKAL